MGAIVGEVPWLGHQKINRKIKEEPRGYSSVEEVLYM
jgi:hypothetical protein